MSFTPASGRTPDGVPVYKFERESTELLLIEPTVPGVEVTDIEVQATDYDPLGETRPAPGDWEAATAAGEEVGLLVASLEPGLYSVWTRYVSNPEIPVRQVAVARVV